MTFESSVIDPRLRAIRNCAASTTVEASVRKTRNCEEHRKILSGIIRETCENHKKQDELTIVAPFHPSTKATKIDVKFRYTKRKTSLFHIIEFVFVRVEEDYGQIVMPGFGRHYQGRQNVSHHWRP